MGVIAYEDGLDLLFVLLCFLNWWPQISFSVGFLNSQKIAEQKLQAFAIGAMGQRPLSRREQEERRKKEEEQAAASVCGKCA